MCDRLVASRIAPLQGQVLFLRSPAIAPPGLMYGDYVALILQTGIKFRLAISLVPMTCISHRTAKQDGQENCNSPPICHAFILFIL